MASWKVSNSTSDQGPNNGQPNEGNGMHMYTAQTIKEESQFSAVKEGVKSPIFIKKTADSHSFHRV